MDRQTSLYEYILQNVRNGRLEEDFSLPEVEDESGVRFADGAMNGIMLFHMGTEPLDEAGEAKLSAAVKAASAGEWEEADRIFSELGKRFRAVGIIDGLQRHIIENREELSADGIYRSACRLILHSADRESVKSGLSMLELFVKPEERIKEAVRTLGLSDEFTVFALWNMRKWNNGNGEIFDLARKVRGWGRIHAMEMLEAETPEISEWMLFSGIDNDVMPAYSALTVWEKADCGERLRGLLTPEEFRAFGRLFRALLDEGPVAGISDVEDAEEEILRYLSLAEGFALSEEDFEAVEEIRDWAAEEDRDLPAVVKRCEEILTRKGGPLS